MALAGAWVLADLARQFVLTGFPWNPWGSVWEIPGPSAMCSSSPPPGSACTASPWQRCCSPPCRSLGWRWRVGGRGAARCLGRFGVLRLQPAVAAAAALTVVLVQGNVAQGQKWDQDLAVRIFRHYLDLTAQGAPAGARPPW